MEPPSSGRIGVVNHSGKRLSSVPVLRAAEAALGAASSSGDVCILLTTDDEVRSLNRRFRNVDEITDVLTFPARTDPNPDGPRLLGDVAIAVPYAARQATLRKVSLEVEIQYLAIHGVLHLLGYNDEIESEQASMMREMDRIGQQLGLPRDPEWTSLLHSEPA